MKKYLATLHTKPERHKKRFALLVSGGTTLAIFALWTMVTFGTGGTLAQNDEPKAEAVKEVSPLESLQMGVAASFAGLRQMLGTMKAGLGEMVDLEADYTEMKSGVLTNYGQ